MQGQNPNPDAARAALPTWVALLVLVLLGAAWHGHRASKPFGIVDINGGGYCGLFLKHYEDHGLLAVRGMGMTPRRVFNPSEANPYLQHPPGLFWFMYLFGTAEWAIRMPTVLMIILGAGCLFALLRPHLGPWPALAAGALLLGAPGLAVYTQASLSPMLTGAGLLFWLATLRVQAAGPGSARTVWRTVQVAVAFVGPWFDWAFALYCLGVVPLVATRSLATTVRRLAAPAIAAGLAAVSIIAWRAWALQAPALEFSGTFPSMGELISSTVLKRPPLSESLERAGYWIPVAAGWPLALAALAGVALLARRAPRLALGLALTGCSHFVLFADHALDHVYYYCLLCSLLAASTAALGTLRARPLRLAAGVGLPLLILATWWTTWQLEQRNTTPFFARLGQVMVDATLADRPDGSREPARLVTTNFHYPFAYYDDTPYIVAPPCLTNLQALKIAQRDPGQPHGVGYLWFKRMEGSFAQTPLCRVGAELAAYLDAHPKTRVPGLELELNEPGIEFDLKVREVWLVQLPHLP